MEYRKRLADEILKEKLAGKGAVLIEGPKWCGKTTTAEQQAKSVIYMDDPRKSKTYKLLVQTDPQKLFSGETPVLIDEWQLSPELWDVVRFEVDHRRKVGQFMLTGSAVPADKSEINHTGTGRFSWLKMRPMTLMESGESNAKVSLKELFESDKTIYADNRLSLEDIAFLICRGGWPFATYLEKKLALNQAKDYYDAVVSNDVSRVDGVNRDSEKVKRLMRSYARLQGSQCGEDTIAADMQTNEVETISPPTVKSYIDALKKIFVIEDMDAWNPNLRSKAAIRTSATRYFVDPSIAAASLGFGPEDLFDDLKTLGLMFETLVIRDLRVYSEVLDGNVYHYRDSNNLECDAVIHLRNGRYGLVEIKLGGDDLIEQGAKTLKKLADIIDCNKMKSPAFMMVITASTPIAYRRKDNVYVVPIGCLGV